MRQRYSQWDGLFAKHGRDAAAIRECASIMKCSRRTASTELIFAESRAVDAEMAREKRLAREMAAFDRLVSACGSRPNSSYEGAAEWGDMGKHDPSVRLAYLVGMNDRVTPLRDEFDGCYIPISSQLATSV